ncbi:hypothetical protein SV7mr_43830 [Stieleria bergensis]|uniref:Uncharacterized protein n=1 Tax=Stieleria bergensis TaxID=2528025 RepID=A0A517T0I1_9BACT|nr:MAG: hypothetical protein CBB71_20205 [Rhodopirellula sp. TMED11]QDT61842.1 hypothetical protein SV7mr_43830 [Planctomycetes bacterium SV_7m_r]
MNDSTDDRPPDFDSDQAINPYSSPTTDSVSAQSLPKSELNFIGGMFGVCVLAAATGVIGILPMFSGMFNPSTGDEIGWVLGAGIWAIGFGLIGLMLPHRLRWQYAVIMMCCSVPALVLYVPVCVVIATPIVLSGGRGLESLGPIVASVIAAVAVMAIFALVIRRTARRRDALDSVLETPQHPTGFSE